MKYHLIMTCLTVLLAASTTTLSAQDFDGPISDGIDSVERAAKQA